MQLNQKDDDRCRKAKTATHNQIIKFLLIMLMFVLIPVFSPVNMMAEDEIDEESELIPIREINIYGFRAPVSGSTPMDSYFLSVDESQGYFIVYEYWYDNTLDQDVSDEGLPFDRSHTYSSGCLICPNDGYTIAGNCIFRINGSTRLVDLSRTNPHAYLDGDWFIQSIGVQCAESEAAPAVQLSPHSFTYDGSRKKPAVTVKIGNVQLKKNKDYTVSYENNLNAGTAKAIITLKGRYSGTAIKTFRIKKAAQPIHVMIKTGTAEYRQLQQEAQKITDAITVTGAKGSLVFAIESGSDYITVERKTGIITVKKGTPKGSYKIKVTITAKTTENYLKEEQTVTVKIRVK